MVFRFLPILQELKKIENNKVRRGLYYSDGDIFGVTECGGITYAIDINKNNLGLGRRGILAKFDDRPELISLQDLVDEGLFSWDEYSQGKAGFIQSSDEDVAYDAFMEYYKNQDI